MPLTNAQYDEIGRIYSRRQQRDLEDQQQRIRRAYEQVPGLKEIEEKITDLTCERGRAMLTGQKNEAERTAGELLNLRASKKKMLADAGLAADELEIRYECPDCRDTGYVGGEICHCRKKAVMDLLYKQSTIGDALQRENFRTFRFDVFDKEKRDPQTGRTGYETMQEYVRICRDFIDGFPGQADNLLFTGQAGTGKTFLSHCIAEELIRRCFSVLYLPAPKLFERLADSTFRRDGSGMEDADDVMTCDLLIIDDLGTELANSFTSSQLFTCINERILGKRPTLISTNLSMNEMAGFYTDRITSRLMGSYRILRFPDRDIRVYLRFGENGK